MLRPREQHHPNNVLQILDGLAQWRLRHMKTLGGAAEVKLFSNGHKLVQKTTMDYGGTSLVAKQRRALLDIQSERYHPVQRTAALVAPRA